MPSTNPFEQIFAAASGNKSIAELSDDELNALASKRGLLADDSPASLESMSDDDLESLASSRGISLKGSSVPTPVVRIPQGLPPLPSSVPDHIRYGDGTTVPTVSNQPPPPKGFEGVAQPGGKGQSLPGFAAATAPPKLVSPPGVDATRSFRHSRLQQLSQAPLPVQDNSVRMQIGRKLVDAANGLNDFFFNVDQLPAMKKLGWNLNAGIESQRRAAAQQEALTPTQRLQMKEAGFAGGLAELVDMFPNVPLGLLQELYRVPPEKRIKSDLSGWVDQHLLPDDVKKAAPDAYNQYKTMAGFAAPIPNASLVGTASKLAPKAKQIQILADAMKAGNPFVHVADNAAVGAVLGGGGVVSDKLKENQNIDPVSVFLGLGGGAAAGGMLGTAMHAPGLLKAAAEKARFKLPTIAPLEAPGAVKSAAASAKSSLNEMIDAFAAKLKGKKAGAQPSPESFTPDYAPGETHPTENLLDVEDPEIAALLGIEPKVKLDVQGQVLPQEELHAPPAMSMEDVSRPSPAPANIAAPQVTPPKLPSDLSKAKPKYREWLPDFQGDDLSKALYTVANRKNRSSADDRYMKWIQETTGWSDEQILSAASRVQQTVKTAPKGSDAEFAVPVGTHGFKPRVRFTSQYGKQFLQEPAAEQSLFDELFNSAGAESTQPESLGGNDAVDTARGNSVLDASAPADQGAQWRHVRQSLGRNKIDDLPTLEGHPDFDTPEMRQIVSELAPLRAQSGYDRKVLEDYVERMMNQEQFRPLVTHPEGRDDVLELAHNGLYARRHLNENLRRWQQDDLDNLRSEEYQRMVREGTAPEPTLSDRTIAGTMGHNYLSTPVPGAKRFEQVPIPATLDDAFNQMKALKAKADVSEKQYDAARKNSLTTFAEMERKIQAADPQAKMAFRTTTKTPLGEDADVAFEYRFGALKHKLDQQANAVLAAHKEALLAADRNKLPRYDFKASTRKLNSKELAKKAALSFLGGALLTGDQQAEAADGKSRKEPNPAWTYSKMAIAAGLLAYGNRTAARAVLTRTQTHIIALFNDSVDHVQHLDDLFGTDVAKQIWLHGGATMRASFGVKFSSQVELQTAKDMLRKNLITAQEARAGKAGTPFENMTPEQRNALYTFKVVQDRLGALVSNQVKHVEQQMQQKISAGEKVGGIEESLKVLKSMESALTGRGAAEDNLSKWYAKGLSNFYDYHFFWNPVFHGTNLTDMFIAGGSRVGPINIGRSIKLLSPLGDKELNALFKTSNLSGGLEVERAKVASIGGMKGLLEKDIPSDKINADRVALGSLLQFAQTKGKLNGWKGSDVDFAKEFMRGGKGLDPTMAMDAQVHLAETMSRTLGVDPMRLNTDWLSRSPYGPILGVFSKQPSRISRLALNYMADGNVRGLMTMLGFTALFAGDAAINTESGYLWRNVDPDSYFLASSLLEKVEVWENMTGNDLSPKLKWAMCGPLLSSQVPTQQSLDRGMLGVMKTLRNMDELGTSDGKGKALNAVGNLLSVMQPRVKGVPTGELIRVLKAANQSMGGKISVHAFDSLGTFLEQPIGSKSELSFDEAGTNPVMHFIDEALIPGDSGAASKEKKAELESHYRELTGQDVNPVNQFFMPAGTKGAPRPVQTDLLHAFFGR